MWPRPDVIGLFPINVVSFSRNMVLRDHLFSLNSVLKPRILSVRTVYVLSSLQVGNGFSFSRAQEALVLPAIVTDRSFHTRPTVT